MAEAAKEAVRNKIENSEICKECGGRCCKNKPCNCLPMDFKDLSYEGLLKELETGNYSIDMYFEDEDEGIHEDIRYIRARAEGYGVVDHESFYARCVNLTKNGCKFDYEHRPSGG